MSGAAAQGTLQPADQPSWRVGATFNDYRDEHNLSIVLASLARLYQAAHDATLAAAAGAVLGVPAEEAQALMEAAIHE